MGFGLIRRERPVRLGVLRGDVAQVNGLRSTAAGSLGAFAIGALAVGALSIGAVAIGRLAIGRLALRQAKIKRLEIEELEVGRLRVRDLVVEHESSATAPAMLARREGLPSLVEESPLAYPPNEPDHTLTPAHPVAPDRRGD